MRQRVIPAVPEKIVHEEIVGVSYNDLHRSAEAIVCQGELVEGEFVPDRSTMRAVKLDYDTLMAAGKKSGKPINEFRRDDIWGCIRERRGL